MARFIVAASMMLATMAPATADATDPVDDLSEGFAHIDAMLGPSTVGAPVSVELPTANDDGTYQLTQRTDGTPGLLRWQRDTNDTTFTDGVQTWSLASLTTLSPPKPKTGVPVPPVPPVRPLPPLKVAQCESGNSSSAVSSAGARSRWQIMPSTYAASPPGKRGVPILQGADEAAAWLYATRGLQPWAASRGCWGG